MLTWSARRVVPLLSRLSAPIFPQPAQEEATYYVATTGSDSNSGTIGNPFLTIQKAADVVVAGDTVAIRGGQYNEQVTITTNGTAGNPITFVAYSGETPIIDGTGVTLPNWSGLVLVQASYIVLDGLEVRNSQSVGVYISGNRTNNTLQNLSVHDCGQAAPPSGSEGGILVGGNTLAAYTTIKDCTVYDNYKGGIVFWQVGVASGGYYLIENNELYGNITTDNFDQIQIMDTPFVVIRNNIIHDLGGSSGDFLDIGGNEASGPDVHDYLVEKNTIYAGSGPAPMAVKFNNYNTRMIFRRNAIHGDGFDLYGQENQVKVYNNTIYGGTHMLLMSESFTNPDDWGDIAWKNNLWAGDTSGVAFNTLNGDTWVEMDYSALPMDGNLYRFNGKGWNFVHAGTNYSYTDSLAQYNQWRTDLGQEPDNNGVYCTQTIGQLLTDAANRDFTLPVGSDAIDAGVPLTLTNGSGVSSTSVVVDDSRWFFDGHGWLTGDTILVGGSQTTITAIDDGTNTLTVSPAISWSDGDEVHLADFGTTPNIGAEP